MIGWAKTEDMLPPVVLIKHGTELSNRILCIRKGDREVFVWNLYSEHGNVEGFKRKATGEPFVTTDDVLRIVKAKLTALDTLMTIKDAKVNKGARKSGRGTRKSD